MAYAAGVDLPLSTLLESPTLSRWVAPQYLSERWVRAAAAGRALRPLPHYLVLDDLFRADRAESLRDHIEGLEFSEDLDRRARGGTLLPYDSAVKFADASDVGHDLFSDPAWHAYLAAIVGAPLHAERHSVVKLRRHRADAGGFWIHSDAIVGVRSVVAIGYLNHDWRAEDGGLLQLWSEEETPSPDATPYDVTDPTARLHVLETAKRIRTHTAGALASARREHTFALEREIVPQYNRLFVCDVASHPAWHAVTPSHGRVRYGFVQWIG